MSTSSSSKFARRDLFSSLFSLAIVASALFVTQHFVLPLLWAVILCIATWPMYARLLRLFNGRGIVASLAATVISALLFIVPLTIALTEAAREAPALAAWVADANNNGLAAPDWVLRVPLAGAAIHDWWVTTLSQPHGIAHLLHGTGVAALAVWRGELHHIAHVVLLQRVAQLVQQLARNPLLHVGLAVAKGFAGGNIERGARAFRQAQQALLHSG